MDAWLLIHRIHDIELWKYETMVEDENKMLVIVK
jgi:hypothetical protein